MPLDPSSMKEGTLSSSVFKDTVPSLPLLMSSFPCFSPSPYPTSLPSNTSRRPPTRASSSSSPIPPGTKLPTFACLPPYFPSRDASSARLCPLPSLQVLNIMKTEKSTRKQMYKEYPVEVHKAVQVCPRFPRYETDAVLRSCARPSLPFPLLTLDPPPGLTPRASLMMAAPSRQVFCHAAVFDPCSEALVRLQPLPEALLGADVGFLGADLPPKVSNCSGRRPLPTPPVPFLLRFSLPWKLSRLPLSPLPLPCAKAFLPPNAPNSSKDSTREHRALAHLPLGYLLDAFP